MRVTNPDGFAVTDLWLSPSTPAPTVAVTPPQVRSWSATSRRVEVAATTSAAVLGVNESFNQGWTGSLDGNELEPVVLDGWRQGFVLPAGTAGVVELRYGPQTAFAVALWGGLVAVALLLLVALGLVVGRVGRLGHGVVTDSDSAHEPRVARVPSGPRAWVPELLVLAVMAVVSLPLAVGALVGGSTRRRDVLQVVAGCGAMLVLAAALALSTSSVVVPPVGSDVVAALAVGIVCGRVLARQ